MKSKQKIIMYLLLMSLLTTLGVWFCMSDKFLSVHACLLKFKIFSMFKGQKGFWASLLSGVCTTAWFATFGFCIDYLEIKRIRQDELKRLYISIKNRCFSRILYEQNSYDDDYEEVASICDFLSENMTKILDYRPLLLIFKVRLIRCFDRSASKNKIAKEQNTSSTDQRTLYVYENEDKYALICSIFSDLYTHFTLVHMRLAMILESDKLIQMYEKKINTLTKFKKNTSVYSSLLEIELKAQEERKHKPIAYFDKKDLIAKFYSVDLQSADSKFEAHRLETIFMNDVILEDKKVKYDTENIHWIFFDVGSTLVDESLAWKHRIEDTVKGSSVGCDLFYQLIIYYEEHGKIGYEEAVKSLSLQETPWHIEDEFLYPRVESCLKRLSEKYKIGIIANQPLGTRDRLNRMGIGKYISLVISSAEENIAKPNLEIFKLALDRAQCLPSKAVMIGDRLDNDIAPAKTIGMGTIWVKQGISGVSSPNDDRNTPDFTIDSINEVCNCFGL